MYSLKSSGVSLAGIVDIRSDSLIFEVENLYYLHLQLLYVSRCGMVYIDPNNFLWKAVVKSLIGAIPSNVLNSNKKNGCNNYFRNYLENILNLTENIYRVYKSDEEDINPNMKKDIKQGVKPVTDQTDFEVLTKTIFFYDVVCEQVNLFMKLHEKILPDTETGKLIVWEVQEYKYEAENPFINILVPTVDTLRYSFITDLLIDTYLPTMYFGETGVGKSVIVYDLFERTRETKARLPVIINFSAQTSSGRTQIMIESKILFKGDHYTTPLRQSVVLFIDDFNMPAPDTFGSQPPLELLRQMLDTDGLYDRTQLAYYELHVSSQ
ncbi:MAG: putative dynein heavy chain [Streblomastix strix]|uniref:Putative dynein heavy chain n=1 Tax=Streblomastix strix TaxID=222440 RepID=A0A5J4WX43_9EUKA|nr:MAG: putative dynein heavy chain [Streblomastix strix]